MYKLVDEKTYMEYPIKYNCIHIFDSALTAEVAANSSSVKSDGVGIFGVEGGEETAVPEIKSIFVLKFQQM